MPGVVECVRLRVRVSSLTRRPRRLPSRSPSPPRRPCPRWQRLPRVVAVRVCRIRVDVSMRWGGTGPVAPVLSGHAVCVTAAGVLCLARLPLPSCSHVAILLRTCCLCAQKLYAKLRALVRSGQLRVYAALKAVRAWRSVCCRILAVVGGGRMQHADSVCGVVLQAWYSVGLMRFHATASRCVRSERLPRKRWPPGPSAQIRVHR